MKVTVAMKNKPNVNDLEKGFMGMVLGRVNSHFLEVLGALANDLTLLRRS